ncbi:hypothetical protein PoB_000301400 [Plakobranchus ocellatus]|uniref:Uncharacterized protein n=1 Tax=Plakobranchus ocellatus TaxID=259542 RepID=A0AAV3Y359_9GAST|nr:hypothetical protein PoB_000301400 [Plakobranchus ocellatus]
MQKDKPSDESLPIPIPLSLRGPYFPQVMRLLNVSVINLMNEAVAVCKCQNVVSSKDGPEVHNSDSVNKEHEWALRIFPLLRGFNSVGKSEGTIV